MHQPLFLSVNNFTGAEITIQLRRVVGFVSKYSEVAVSVDSLKVEIPKEAVAAYDRAMDSARRGELKKVVTDLEKAVKLAPDYYDALLELGLRYHKDGKNADAARVMKHALEVNPASMKARAVLGQQAFEADDFQKAADLLGQAVQLGNMTPNVFLMLGVANFKLERLEVAEFGLLRALDVAPGLGLANLALHNVHLSRYRVSHDRKDLDKALVQLDTYLAKHPTADDFAKVQAAADKIRKALQQ